MSLSPSDYPKSFRPIVLVIGTCFIVAAAAVGAYAGGVTKAHDIAVDVSTIRDNQLERDLNTYRQYNDERIRMMMDTLKNIDNKVDNINSSLSRMEARSNR